MTGEKHLVTVEPQPGGGRLFYRCACCGAGGWVPPSTPCEVVA